MSYYQEMLKEKTKLQEEIKKTMQEMKQHNFPEGRLVCAKNEKRYKWYFSNKGKTKYLPRKEEKLAKQLALKKYYETKLHELQIELEACETYLKKMSLLKYDEETIMFHPEYSKLLSDYFTPVSKELMEWQEFPFESNPNYTEQLHCKGVSGRMLRSKSEVIIDMMLYNYKIPFRYEAKLTLNGIDFYPDFTIRHPKTKELFYWEHFGMMDNRVYSQKAFEKMQIYCENGIIPSYNLITTFETQSQPISVEEVKKIIENYFMNNLTQNR